jgi:hypothetical protein
MGGGMCGGRPRPSATGGGCDPPPARVISPALILRKHQLQNRGVRRMPHAAHGHRQCVVISSRRTDQQLSPLAPRRARPVGEGDGHAMGRELKNVAGSVLTIPSLQAKTAARRDGDRFLAAVIPPRRVARGEPRGRGRFRRAAGCGDPSRDRPPPGTQVERRKVHVSNPGKVLF